MDAVQLMVFWSTGGAVGYAAARRNGFSPVVGSAAGVVMGPIFGCLLFLVNGVASANEMKRCPHCAEWIEPRALVCRFCQRDLPKPPSGPARILRLVSPRRWSAAECDDEVGVPGGDRQ